MDVWVIGPNLPDQSKGQFHVHAAGCRDGVKLLAQTGEPEMAIEVENRLDVEDFIYGPDAGDFDLPEPGAWLDEFHFAPCCDSLPRGD